MALSSSPMPIANPEARTSYIQMPQIAPQPQPELKVQRIFEPPVTRASLNELEVNKIVGNTKLRHDINFDPDLHFRPNIEGDRPSRKEAKANVFWNALHDELAEFVMDRQMFYQNHGTGDSWCLPKLLKVVKSIIHSLVPHRDSQFLDEGLNVDLLMQQFHKGVADLEKLAGWLRGVLKSHCAPMRDSWVDNMYVLLSSGARDGNLEVLVDGMRNLLNVLEAMKLDVANHQIRTLRPVLVEETVSFEQKYFIRKIEAGRHSLTDAREWYAQAEQTYTGYFGNTSHSFGDATVLFHGIAQWVLPSSTQALPETFMFDEDRLRKIKADILDKINLEICMRLHQQAELMAHRFSVEMARLTAELEPARGMEEFDFNRPPTGSRPSSMAFSSTGSANSSPRSSLVVPSYVADQIDAKTKARNLYISLVDLLRDPDSPPLSAQRLMERWYHLAPSIALEILRVTPSLPSHAAQRLEQMVIDNLRSRNTAMYREVEQTIFSHMTEAMSRRARDFMNMSAFELFTTSSNSRSHALSHLSRDKETDRLARAAEDLAVRVTHVGVMHWRVWADMAYLGDVEEMMALDVDPSQI